MLKQIFFPSVFFNPDLFSVQIPFALAALCTGGQMLLPYSQSTWHKAGWVSYGIAGLHMHTDCPAQEQQIMVLTQTMSHDFVSFPALTA